MKKPGHALSEVLTDSPARILQLLSNRFSITTAEELIAANHTAGNRLRESLEVDQSTWERLLLNVQASLAPNEIERLTTPVRARPGGVKIRHLTGQELKRHAPGLSQESNRGNLRS